jgi:hypothetical protein
VPYGVAVASAASIGAGTYFGIRAISRRRASDRDCPDNRCSMEGVSLNEEAKTAAQYCDVTIGLGLVGAAVATYLFLRSPASDSSDGSAAGEGSHVAGARPLRVIPAVGPGVASLLLGGAW